MCAHAMRSVVSFRTQVVDRINSVCVVRILGSIGVSAGLAGGRLRRVVLAQLDDAQHQIHRFKC